MIFLVKKSHILGLITNLFFHSPQQCIFLHSNIDLKQSIPNNLDGLPETG